jgi:hypothetical protein
MYICTSVVSKKSILIILTLSMFFSGCRKDKETINVAPKKDVLVKIIEEEKSLFVFSEKLSKKASEGIIAWDEYFKLSDFLLENYSDVSATQSLEMSKELTEMVKSIKDSMQIPILNTRGMFARLNTLNSEVLRLKDMSIIASIKSEEVLIQTRKIVAVYNAINSKINAVFSQKSFDEDVDFDESIFNFDKKEEKPYYVAKKKRPIRVSKEKFPLK